METLRIRSNSLRRIASALGGLALLGAATAARAQGTGIGDPSGATDSGQLSYPMIFTLFIVMLGPIKLLGPFAGMTRSMELGAARRVALKGFGIACIAGLVAAVMGQKILISWQVAPRSLYLAAGLILLLVALQNVMAQYGPPAVARADDAAPKDIAFSPLAFPTIVTPHGVAVFILLMALSHDLSRDLTILGLFLGVMVLNLITMWFARPILKYGASLLQILGAVLGVLQVALAVQMISGALRIFKGPA